MNQENPKRKKKKNESGIDRFGDTDPYETFKPLKKEGKDKKEKG